LLHLRENSWQEIVALCGYGYVACLLFGALMNIYFWPFGGAGPLGWQPGLSFAETLQRYWAYYVVQSLAWDALRAISTAVLIALLGRPLLRLLRRFRSRFFWNAVELG
jgi:energy-coupling factor transport system substrate-specific component